MGTPGNPEDALLFVAVTFRREIEFAWVEEHLLSPFGRVHVISPVFDFTHSVFYEKEMGANLQKVFVVYAGLYPVETAAETKLKAIALEQAFVVANRRVANIDPGYLTLAKLVLTTTKNYDHRVYLTKGIYADIQLRFRQGAFVTNPWTYPDYRDDRTIAFLRNARTYLQQLARTHEA